MLTDQEIAAAVRHLYKSDMAAEFGLADDIATARAAQAKSACKGIPAPGCNYLASCGAVCSKCGKEHKHHMVVAAAEAHWQAKSGPAVAWMRADGEKAITDFERGAWIDAGRPELVCDYVIPLTSSASGTAETSKAALGVLAERRRQVEVEGWAPEHDDEHAQGEMARAAACYAHPDIIDVLGMGRLVWPWDPSWWKPKDDRSNLVRAAALLLAEIERIDRATPSPGETP